MTVKIIPSTESANAIGRTSGGMPAKVIVAGRIDESVFEASAENASGTIGFPADDLFELDADIWAELEAAGQDIVKLGKAWARARPYRA